MSTRTLLKLGRDQVYKCAEIIHSEREKEGADFAIIKLDRSVHGERLGLSFKQLVVAVGDELTVIGHPSGTPSKVAGGAQVRKVMDQFFLANLDTFSGNSGSPVLAADSLEVVGILVRGETDYEYSLEESCAKVNLCKNDECRGEDVVFASEIKRGLDNPEGIVEELEPVEP